MRALKGVPGLVVLPFNLFYDLKHAFYRTASGHETYLVEEPFVVKAVCALERVMLSVPPGSLVTEAEDAVDVGGCVAEEYFWFKGRRVSWEVSRAPEWLLRDVEEAGFGLGRGGEVVGLEGAPGKLGLHKPWHPAARGLEEGLACEGGDAPGDVLAKCGNSVALALWQNRVYVGKVEEPWRLLPAVAYASSL